MLSRCVWRATEQGQWQPAIIIMLLIRFFPRNTNDNANSLDHILWLMAETQQFIKFRSRTTFWTKNFHFNISLQHRLVRAVDCIERGDDKALASVIDEDVVRARDTRGFFLSFYGFFGVMIRNFVYKRAKMLWGMVPVEFELCSGELKGITRHSRVWSLYIFRYHVASTNSFPGWKYRSFKSNAQRILLISISGFRVSHMNNECFFGRCSVLRVASRLQISRKIENSIRVRFMKSAWALLKASVRKTMKMDIFFIHTWIVHSIISYKFRMVLNVGWNSTHLHCTNSVMEQWCFFWEILNSYTCMRIHAWSYWKYLPDRPFGKLSDSVKEAIIIS